MRRKTAILLGLLAIGACTSARLLLDKGPESGTLLVRVDAIRDTGGSIRVALFAGPEGFPSDPSGAERVESVAVSDSTLTWTTTGVPTGTWAVSVLHDEDGNGEMATDWMGRPAEGWGVSNDARGRFGPPSFADAAFEVDGDSTHITIRLSY